MPYARAVIGVVVAMAAMFVGATPSAADPQRVGVLHVGDSWINAGYTAQSPSGEFSLGIFVYGIQLEQNIETGGQGVSATTWFSQPHGDGHCFRPRLTMEHSGSAVLHCGSHRLWATPTRGSGTANTFQIRDNGMLVVATGTGRVVWRSHSGPALLATRHQLDPGQELRDCPNRPAPCSVLTMRSNGDLTLTFGQRVEWRTGTHTAGSSLIFRRTGALQVVGPRGRILWGSHTGGFGPASYLDVEQNSTANGAVLVMTSMAHRNRHWSRG